MSELSLSNEYRSPDRIVGYAAARWGPFTLDAAAAPWNAQAREYFTKRDNALKYPWIGRVWLNPPYTRGNLALWLAYAREQVTLVRAELVCCLVPAYTCESWWHESVEAPAGKLLGVEHHLDELGAWTKYRWQQLSVTVGRVRGRLRFRERSGKTGSARFSSALVVFEQPGRRA